MLALLGLSYERHAVDMYPGTASAPVLEMGGRRLDDVGTILTALATDHGAHWLPAQTDAARWLRIAATDQRTLVEARHVSMLGQAGDLAALNEQARLVLRAIDDHLTMQAMSGHDWLVDDAPTIADIAVFPS